MTLFRLIAAGLRHHWRTHLAVALGVAACTAVLTGALLVGDSVRGSLRHLGLDRLGAIEVQIAHHDVHPAAMLSRELLGQRAQAILAARRNHEVPPFGGEDASQRIADSARGPCDFPRPDLLRDQTGVPRACVAEGTAR